MFCVSAPFTIWNTWFTKLESLPRLAIPASNAAMLLPIPICTSGGDAPSLSANELVTCRVNRFMIDSTSAIFTSPFSFFLWSERGPAVLEAAPFRHSQQSVLRSSRPGVWPSADQTPLSAPKGRDKRREEKVTLCR
jgi:hypothetical protein